MLIIPGTGRDKSSSGKDAGNISKPLAPGHGSVHPRREMSSAQFNFDGSTPNIKRVQLRAKRHKWITWESRSRSDDDHLPRMSDIRAAVLSTNQMPRRFLSSAGLAMRPKGSWRRQRGGRQLGSVKTQTQNKVRFLLQHTLSLDVATQSQLAGKQQKSGTNNPHDICPLHAKVDALKCCYPL